MTYCHKGQRVTFYYRFANEKENSQVNFDSWINVEIKTNKPDSTDYNPQGYKINLRLYDPFFSSRGGYGMTSFVGKGYKLGELNTNYGYPVSVIGCDDVTRGVGFILPQDLGSITTDTSVKCSNPTELTDTIRVTSPDGGALLFTATGKNAASFSVVCGDFCPEGYLKLDSPNYPGYCCIPCSEVVGGIKSITAAVRGVNRG